MRSGKTFALSLSFLFWAFSRFDGADFALCGKTIASLERNLVGPLVRQLERLGFGCRLQRDRHRLTVTFAGRENCFYLFGGRDESSAALIQGMTLAGCLMDEVVLMPRSFVEQALARCSVSGSKFFFCCNPQHPSHWFYREWIQKRQEKNALYLHFTMEDNPALSPAVRRRYRQLYSGSFYERFVLGRWCAPQGLIYPMFRPQQHVTRWVPEDAQWYLSCDYGILNPMSIGLWAGRDGTWVRVAEYYHDGRATGRQKTDEEYYAALERLANGRPIQAVVVDPSAASFIACIRRHGRYRVLPAQNEVAAGIRAVAELLAQGRLFFSPDCRDSIREFSLYRWKDSPGGEIPLKEHDHAMDDIRYFVMTVARRPAAAGGFCAAAPVRQLP